MRDFPASFRRGDVSLGADPIEAHGKYPRVTFGSCFTARVSNFVNISANGFMELSVSYLRPDSSAAHTTRTIFFQFAMKK